MRKISTCCHSNIHHQNGADFCTNCIRILDKSEIRRDLKLLAIVSSFIVFLYMVLNSFNVYAPTNYYSKSTLNIKKEQTKYAVDFIQIKIIEGNNSNSVSVKGATGNMQIMPVTLEDWNKHHPNEQYTMDDMKDERKNVRVGKWMLENRIPQILNLSKIPLTVNHILIAYNWGCGNIIRWYKSGAVVARLPVETQQYICKYWAKAKL